MNLDFSKLKFDSFDQPEYPVLILKTLSGDILGSLSYVNNLSFTIKYSEPSEVSFEIPFIVDGQINPLYDSVIGYRILYTENLGVYVLMNPEIKGDGIKETKAVKGYSIEKLLEKKTFYYESGTVNFWNPVASTDSLIARILEVSPGWSVGIIASSLTNNYKTFDEINDNVLNFCYNTARDKFRAIFVFDSYNKTISAFDADVAVSTLPIFLSYDNLLKSTQITEKSDGLYTDATVYGADSLSIRDVNPIGTNHIYNLEYFINKGDISIDLKTKWEAWQTAIKNNQQYYTALVSLKASATARLFTENARLTDYKNGLTDLTNQQSVIVQAYALETTDAGRAAQQVLLDAVNAKIVTQNGLITTEQTTIANIQDSISGSSSTSYNNQILAINNTLKMSNYFTADELLILQNHFIQTTITNDSYVASDINVDNSYTSSTITSDSISITGSTIVDINVTSTYGKHIYTLVGGNVSLNTKGISGNIIRGTLEVKTDNSFMLSIFIGSCVINGNTEPSGTFTLTGTLSNFISDITSTTISDVVTYQGTKISFNLSNSYLYFTVNCSDYQAYSVQTDLYEYGIKTLADIATPVYEFDIESSNFIFQKQFQSFTSEIQLGQGVYLQLNDNLRITSILIELDLNYDSPDKFSLVFSNTFQRPDEVNKLKNMIETSYSSSADFDASKYVYNQTSNNQSAIANFLNSALDSAKNTVLAGSDQRTTIDGAGIRTTSSDGKEEIRITSSMLAFTSDAWASNAKIGIGKFYDKNTGVTWGVNGGVIGGTLLIGNSAVIESASDTGVKQFKFDSTGAWLYNSTFCISKDNGGKILIDPRYGIAGGTANLYTTSGTTVTPSFVDGSGNITVDSDGMPTNSNFFVSAIDGKAYFRGKIYASSGYFKGILQASDIQNLSGVSMLNNNYQITGGNIDAKGITVKDSSNNTTFSVDSWGNTTIQGTLNACRIYSPTIYSSWMNVVPPAFSGTLPNSISYNNITYSQGFRMYGAAGSNNQYEYLDIGTYNTASGLDPVIAFFSVNGAQAQWGFYDTHFLKNVEFDGNVTFNGTVSGVTATFG